LQHVVVVLLEGLRLVLRRPCKRFITFIIIEAYLPLYLDGPLLQDIGSQLSHSLRLENQSYAMFDAESSHRSITCLPVGIPGVGVSFVSPGCQRRFVLIFHRHPTLIDVGCH